MQIEICVAGQQLRVFNDRDRLYKTDKVYFDERIVTFVLKDHTLDVRFEVGPAHLGESKAVNRTNALVTEIRFIRRSFVKRDKSGTILCDTTSADEDDESPYPEIEYEHLAEVSTAPLPFDEWLPCEAQLELLEADYREWITAEVRRREHTADEIEHVRPAAITQNDMLTIREAAEDARVVEETIRNWLNQKDGDRPMLPGVVGTGRLTRIPRSSLDPYRKEQKATRKTRGKSARKKPSNLKS